jgi:hypothetical protein
MSGRTAIHDRGKQRVQIQFRAGAALISRIDEAADEDQITRNYWLCRACLRHLRRKRKPGRFSAVEITSQRLPVLFRLPAEDRDRIDQQCAASGMSSRTMWLIEAILAELERPR